MFRLTPAHTEPIGLDIGHDAVKMIQLETSGERLAVRAAARAPFPAEVRDKPELRLPVAVDLIRQLLRRGHFAGRNVVAALPREVVVSKNFRLPQMPPEELASAVEFEAKNQLPFDSEASVVRHLAAGEVRQGADTLQEVILLAARTTDVNTYVEQLHSAGAIIDSIDVDCCALYRSVERFMRRREDEQEVNVLVDIGLGGSLVVIGRGRDITFIKHLEIGGAQLRAAVATKLGITSEEADAVRRRLSKSSVSEGRDPVRQAVFDASRGLLEQLAREVSLCLRYQSVTFRGQRPLRVKLVGGESRDPVVQQVMASALPVPAEVSRPLVNVDTSNMDEELRQGPMSEWALALGLALRRTTRRFSNREGRPRETQALPAPMPEALAAPVATGTTAAPVNLDTQEAEEVARG